MLRRTIVTVGILACLATMALAHEPWEYGYAWIGRIPDHINVPGHNKGEIPVKIQMVRWADLYFNNENDNSLILKQLNGTYDFADCILLRICQNFLNMSIVADIEKTSDTLVDDGWSVYLEYDPNNPMDPNVIPTDGWMPNSADVLSVGPHLTGDLGYLKLCIKVKGVDMQSELYDPAASQKEVAVVRLTMYPSDAPGQGDRYAPVEGGRISPWTF
jgi:hypothetical protein